MSIIKKILGTDAESLLESAREKERDGDLGGAVIDYERAIETLEEKDAYRRDELKAKVTAIRDGIADKYLADAEAALGAGELERAAEALTLGFDVAGSAAKKDEIEKRRETLQRQLAEADVGEMERSLDEEEVFQALSGAWTQPQIDEFDGYGEAFRAAYMKFHGGKIDEAVEGYRAILKAAGDDALYLKLELARALHMKAHALAGQEDRAREVEALRDEAVELIHAFRENLPKRRTPEVRAAAWSLLAQIYIDKKDPESAEDALVEAQGIIPEEPAVYLNLGRFLVDQGRQDDALYALEQGEKLMDKFHPNLELMLILGLTHRRAGNREAAIVRLQGIIDYFLAVGRTEWDPAVAHPLAELYAEVGKEHEACDLYRNLSTVGERENLGLYNYEAARLMMKLSFKKSEIAPYLLRAREHAADGDLRKKIDELERP
jgi:tetratricopeptide (TPR) repeat protein